jgi:stearoyl-CoA desaturase (delta-9 desaturase)
MFYGFFPLPWWGYIVVVLGLTHITILAVTLYLHRCSAHRALDVHPIVSHFFRMWLWLTTGQSTRAWTAIHRKHHAKCETPEDPHSPIIFGITKVLWQGAELYRKEAKNQHTIERYGKGTPNDWLENRVYTKSQAGLYIMMLINILMFGVPGIAIWAVQMCWIPFFAAGVVNGLGHYWGYRNFECQDASTNLSPIGILIGGEELHNNHHTYPTSAKFSIKPWEFDIGWGYITLLSLLGLAKVRRVAPQEKIIPGKSLDADTVTAVFYNRFQVLSQYSQAVLLPVFQQAKQKLASAEASGAPDWQAAKTALVRDKSLVEPDQREQLSQVMIQDNALNRVVELREKLVQIWGQTQASSKELIEAMHNWCKEAENTNIQALKEFSAYLQGYSLKQEG